VQLIFVYRRGEREKWHLYLLLARSAMVGVAAAVDLLGVDMESACFSSFLLK